MPFNPKQIQEEIVDQYLYDDNPRPWIVGFSGGKDSTMLLQLVWYALKAIPAELRTRKIYVVCNNTLVENPKILDYTRKVFGLKEVPMIQVTKEEKHLKVLMIISSITYLVVGFAFAIMPERILKRILTGFFLLALLVARRLIVLCMRAPKRAS